MTAARPPSFATREMWKWAPWVLDHGLPSLPEVLGPGSGVPVAVFRSRTRGAVLLVYRSVDLADDAVPFVDSDAVGFRRHAAMWEQADGSGGGVWSDDFDLRRPVELGAREVRSYGWAGSIGRDWSVMTPFGIAGSEASTVEVEQDGAVEVAPLNSPIGAWIAATDGRLRAVVRVRDAGGQVLLELMVPSFDE